MKRFLKKLLCLVLAVSMLLSLGAPAFAATDGAGEEQSAEKGFDFECSDYSVNEDGTLAIRILRNDAGNKAAILSVRAADLMSEYGTDYVILDENGEEFVRVEGIKPDASELTADDGTLFGDEIGLAAPETASGVIGTSNLANAAAQYLKTDAESSVSTEESVTEALSSLNDFFGKAQGAKGEVRFARGETEKTLTVKPLNNTKFDGTRLFMLGITGVLGKEEEVMIAPNATTYVNLFDDETETVRYTLVDNGTVLTKDAPSAEITVKRISGTADFSTVYVSTVKETAPDGSYDAFHDTELSFLPGESEKTVTVTAYDFSEGGAFGLRLESLDDAEFDCGYITVGIDKKGGFFAGLLGAAQDDGILGEKYSTTDGVPHEELQTCLYGNGLRHGTWVTAGRSEDVTVEFGESTRRPSTLGVRESYIQVENHNNSYGGACTLDELNFAGVRNVIVDMNRSSFSAGVDISPDWLASAYVRYEPSKLSTRALSGTTMRYSAGFNGSYVVQFNRYTINTASFNAPAYVNFWTRFMNMTLYGVNLEHTLYKFEPRSNNETFTRTMYDFSDKTYGEEGFRLNTYYDGLSTLKYNPGSVRVTYDGDDVSGFYSNAGKIISIIPENLLQLEKSGLELAGVYITSSSVLAEHIPNSADAGKPISKGLYKAAGNNEVMIPLDGSFVQELVEAGAASATNPESETLRIYPVYREKLVKVIFKHGVSPDCYLWNVEKSYENYGDNKKDESTAGVGDIYRIDDYQGTGETVYAMTVPRTTVLRVRAVIGAGNSFAGICAKPARGEAEVFFHHAGDQIASSVDPKGITVKETDPSIADISAENYELYPNTGKQSIYIGFHGSYDAATDSMNMADRPEDIASRLTCITDMSACDENGVFELDAVSGNTYSFNIVPPEGCYVVWTNMSGDANGNGVIDSEAERTVYNDREKSVNPVEIYGNRLNITVDSDNIRYYYKFIELSRNSQGELINQFTKSAKVMRESNTFYRLVNNPDAPVTTEPVTGATVSVAQWSALTDSKGKFTLTVGGLNNAGALSGVAMVEGLPFNFKTYIETTNDVITVPALYRFTAQSLSASYEESAYAKCAGASSSVIVQDDILTIKAQVGSFGTIRPADAKFRLLRDGMLQEEFYGDSVGASVRFEKLYGGGTAVLAFNPSKFVQTGDKLYVSFMAEDGTWYPFIDLGYSFVSTLVFQDLMLPIFGAGMIEDVNDISVDLLGSVLSDLNMGSLSDFGEAEARTVSPANISDAEKASGLYDWTELQYSGGANAARLPQYDKNSTEYGQPAGGEEHEFTEEEMAEGLKRLQEADNVEDAVKPKGSKYTTTKGYLWNIELGIGFRLIVSQRVGADGQPVTCFEDLAFYLKVKTTVNASISVALPIGISFAFKFGLDLNAVGIYHLYNNYRVDNRHIEGTVPFEGFRINTNDEKISREGYIFVDPIIKAHFEVSAGILTVGGGATFTLDMDFAIRADADGGSDVYGGLDIDMDWYIKLLGFAVYKKDYDTYDTKLFGSQPINFDIGQNTKTALAANLGSAENGVFSLDTPTDRSYIENRSEWLGGRRVLQTGSAAVSERTLMRGTATEPFMNVTSLGDGKMLMVFIGDDPERTDVNKRTLYWSVSEDSGETWSEPVILDDDGTLDDYPEVFDLGNGRLLVSWSSVDSVLPEGATIEDALRGLNIKAAFFDSEKLRFGNVEQLTRTTEQDFCADTQPHAAYDSGTDRIILYYTKTEYNDLSELDALGKAESMTAYLFYEDGKWSNTGDAYTENELAGAADPAAYREQWYGQRFLDPRIDKSSAAMPMIVSSDAVCYNHLALYTWITDWDNDRGTTDDRDVFLQVYNFNQKSFTHPFRVTKQSGNYTLPTLLKTDDTTLLFFGQLDSEGESTVCTVDIAHAIADRQYTLRSEGNVKYYEFCYTVTDEETGESSEVWVPALTASSCGNIEDYTVCCSDTGTPFILWTDAADDGRQIYASMQGEDGLWSLPYQMTEAGGSFYNGISAAVVDGFLFVGSGKGSYSDASDTSVVLLRHKPGSEIVLDSIEAGASHPQPGQTVPVTVKLLNKGLLPTEIDTEVSLSLNAGEAQTEAVKTSVLGGESVEITVNVTVPAEFTQLCYTAVCGDQTISRSYEREAVLEISGGEVVNDCYTLTAENKGNAAGFASFTVYAGEKTVGSAVLSAVPMGEKREISIPLSLADSDFILVPDSDIAYVELSCEGKQGEDSIYNGSSTAYRRFDADAVRLLSAPDPHDEMILNAKPGELLHTELPEGLRILWTESSDPATAKLTESGYVITGAEGTTTLRGIVIPDKNLITVGADGREVATDWTRLIPDYLFRTVTAELTVAENNGTFPDVPEDSDYFDAVEWIAAQGITEGYADGSFRPKTACNRGQVVTFLWRAANCPEPENGENPFTDVEDSGLCAPYYKAILWANEQGIAKGYEDGSFRPFEPVTRAQFVTFLWRYAGEPASEADISDFTDSESIAEPYRSAVAWAVGNGVTLGYPDGSFRPNDACTRWAVALFMYRELNK